MKNKFSKALGLFAISGLLFATPAMAQTGFSGLLSSTWLTQFQSGADLMSIIAYLAGIAFGIKGVINLKQWNESKGRDSTLMQGLIPILLAGVLLGLPTILKAAKESTAGTAGGASLGTGTTLRTIQ